MMGHWGVKSYENDLAADALDAGYERAHGDAYEELMDDRNPMGFDEVQGKLASPETLAYALEALRAEVGHPMEDWDDDEKLAYCGVVVRHAEARVPLDDAMRTQAIEWLENEAIDWDEATVRKLRREREVATLKKGPGA